MRNRREFIKGLLRVTGIGAVLPFVSRSQPAVEAVTANRVFALTDNAGLTEFCDSISGMSARARGRAFQAVAKMIGMSPEVNEWGEIYTAPVEIFNSDEVARDIKWEEEGVAKMRQRDWDYEIPDIANAEERIARLRALQRRRASFDIYEDQKGVYLFAEI